MRDKLIELLEKKYDHYCDQCGVNKDTGYIENLADHLIAHGVTFVEDNTATEQAYKNGYEQGKKDAVKHGWQEKSKESEEWYGKYFTCLECHTRTMAIDPHFDLIEPSYCPNCGAKMDGEADG